MQMNTLQDLFVETLRDLYDAEMQELGSAPAMAQAVSSPELQEALIQHTKQTEQQVQRLEQVFRGLGEQPGGHKCRGMEGLLSENKEILQAKGDPDVLDAGLICGQQKIEHYEIAGYGTAVTFAKMLGQQQAAKLLAQTLDEEEKIDQKLSQLAKAKINPDAEAAGGEMPA